MSPLRKGLKILVYVIFAPAITIMLFFKMLHLYLLPAAVTIGQHQVTAASTAWRAPAQDEVNSLHSALHSKGVYNFVFNSSQTPSSLPYNTYNWCNMPHARRQEYKTPPAAYELQFVEIIHRHHKRTPYASNTFPIETQRWECENTALYNYAAPYPSGNKSALAFSRYYLSSVNPFIPAGFPPHDCAFPQITKEGLDDSFQHGKDLYGVYHDLLHFLPADALSSGAAIFRVSDNPITSQVAGMVISGMFGQTTTPLPLYLQAPDVDSIEPAYSCPAANTLYSTYGVGSSNPNWTEHLTKSQGLFNKLDAISGVAADDPDWHVSYDHYFDNLSARLCHQKPLPCNDTFTPTRCVTQADADEVFRMGEYEYSFIYRDGGPDTIAASTASFGVWLAELAHNLVQVREGKQGALKYLHNVGHDGSIARLLSVLQIEKMVWPGMGSEVVFELYKGPKKDGQKWFVRILWSGQVLRSSSLGLVDMMPLPTFLAYIDALVGRGASKIPGLCAS